MTDFQTDTIRKARKPHVCCECRGAIQPGVSYRLTDGCWDGQFSIYKTCLDCVAAREWAIAQPEWEGDGDFLWYFERLREDLIDLAAEIHTWDGRRFHSLRLSAQMAKRGAARRQQLKEIAA